MIDLDALVLAPCQSTWGEAVFFQPAAGPTLTVAGIWNEKYEEMTWEDGNPTTNSKPRLDVRASAFNGPQPLRDDCFLIRGRLWAVETVKPDGLGLLHLQMRLANDAQITRPVVAATPPPPQ